MKFNQKTRKNIYTYITHRVERIKQIEKMADSANKRNIPIKLGDFSVIDTEFSSIRERFDSEMRKMEDEMAKFRSDLMNREANYFETTTRYDPALHSIYLFSHSTISIAFESIYFTLLREIMLLMKKRYCARANEQREKM